MEPQRVEAVGGDVDGLMQISKGQVRSATWEMSSSEKRGNRGEREKREERRDKREARREKREERREKREERREK